MEVELARIELLAESLSRTGSAFPASFSTEHLLQFTADVQTVVNALMVGAKLEGESVISVREEFKFHEEVPEARALVETESAVFSLLAKPYINVEDVDSLLEWISSLELSGKEPVPLLAGYDTNVHAERYARSLDIEVLRLGL